MSDEIKNSGVAWTETESGAAPVSTSPTPREQEAEPKPRIKMVCERCGSDNVRVDAWACWDVEKQDWVLEETFPDEFCGECDGETTIEELPL